MLDSIVILEEWRRMSTHIKTVRQQQIKQLAIWLSWWRAVEWTKTISNVKAHEKRQRAGCGWMGWRSEWKIVFFSAWKIEKQAENDWIQVKCSLTSRFHYITWPHRELIMDRYHHNSYNNPWKQALNPIHVRNASYIPAILDVVYAYVLAIRFDVMYAWVYETNFTCHIISSTYIALLARSHATFSLSVKRFTSIYILNFVFFFSLPKNMLSVERWTNEYFIQPILLHFFPDIISVIWFSVFDVCVCVLSYDDIPRKWYVDHPMFVCKHLFVVVSVRCTACVAPHPLYVHAYQLYLHFFAILHSNWSAHCSYIQYMNTH